MEKQMEKKNGVVEDFVFYARAGYPYFYVETYEMSRCIELLQEAISKYKNKDGDKVYSCGVWDIQTAPEDAGAVLEEIMKAEENSVYFLKNFGWFLKDDYGNDNKQVITTLQNNYNRFCKKGARKIVVIISDKPIDEALPSSISHDFLSLSFDLPIEREIEMVLDKIIQVAEGNKKFKPPTKETRERLVDAALGMSLQEAENAFAWCAIKHMEMLPKVIDRLKAQQVEKIEGVSYEEYDSTFDQLKGYEQVKKFILGTIKHPNSKGVILLGPAGTGKSYLCQCLANETGMRMLTWEMAEFQGGIVGETERKWRDAIKVTKAMAGSKGVIVFIDELEKGMAGSGGGAGQASVSSDSITKRAAGQFLKFMQNPGCKVYFVATCNDVSAIPPEYLRAERWDTAPFFVDLPNEIERKAILDHYRKFYNVNGKLKVKDTEGWSGAELKAVCRIADMMGSDTEAASNFIVPVSATMSEQIDGLRKWANAEDKKGKRRTIPASTPVKIKQVKGGRSLEI